MQGYLYIGGAQALPTSVVKSGGDTITAKNVTDVDIESGKRVWVEPVPANTADFSVAGSPTIINKVISGFSGANYSYFLIYDNKILNTWEIGIKFTYASPVNNYAQVILIQYTIPVGIILRCDPDGKMAWSLATSDNIRINTSTSDSKGTTTLVDGNTYYIKALYDGTKYQLLLSTDGTNYNTEIEIISSLVVNAFNEAWYLIGSNTNNIQYFRGSIDLSETYVKLNGNVFWTPYTTATTYNIIPSTDITSTSFTGITQEAIEDSISGSVKTLLDGNGTYAPALGTKTITVNDTYTANAEDLYGYSSVTVNVSSGKYQLLDRVKDDSNNEIGTVSGFFTDANNVEYAVVCLDAQYRLASGKWASNSGTVTNLPSYSNLVTSNGFNAWSTKETATTNTQLILDWCTTNSYTSTACSHCRSNSFTIDGTTYYSQLPSLCEISDIAKNYGDIELKDTSSSSYTSLNFASGRNMWASTQYTSTMGWMMDSTGKSQGYTKSTDYFVVPVLEIPNTQEKQ